MTKQTTANNRLLAKIKKVFNAKIFKKASDIFNEEGKEACLLYIGTFFNDTVRQCALKEFVEASNQDKK